MFKRIREFLFGKPSPKVDEQYRAHIDELKKERRKVVNKCGQCRTCKPNLPFQITPDGSLIGAQRFIVCDICGNKRCPHATNCELNCTNSNEPGQKGSFYE